MPVHLAVETPLIATAALFAENVNVTGNKFISK